MLSGSSRNLISLRAIRKARPVTPDWEPPGHAFRRRIQEGVRAKDFIESLRLLSKAQTTTSSLRRLPIWDGMKTSSSFRQLLRNLHLAAKVPTSWVLLHPGHVANQRLWTAQRDEIIPLPHVDKMAPVLARIPTGGHPATNRAFWATELTAILFGPDAKNNDFLILPIYQESELVACLCWTQACPATGSIMADASTVRRTFRLAWALESARSECHAMRWVLSRCDRLVAAVRHNGEILALSPSASDLLKSLEVGPCHYFHTGQPELPPHLAQAIAKKPTGQVKLGRNCAARFDPISSTSDAWQPIIGVEFFVEKVPPLQLPPPISLLTPVERQVFALIKTGATNKEISQQRGTAFATTKNQVSTILSKMGVTRRHHLLICRPDLSEASFQLHKPGMNGVTNSSR